MLPFTKRALRPDEASSEVISTGEIEVVPASNRRVPTKAFPPPLSRLTPSVRPPGPLPSPLPPPSRPAPPPARPSPPPPRPVPPPRAFAHSTPSARPRVFEPASSDEEMTTLLPRKGMIFSSRPPAAAGPVPMPRLAVTRTPRAMFEEPPTRHFSRNSIPPPSLAPSASIGIGGGGIGGGVRASKRPAALPIPPLPAMAAAKLPPPPVNLKSDPRSDPPATVITARTSIAARPTVSWAAALVAMGVFVGLVTAVVARGDGDTLIDAAASFVDPSGAHAAASAVEASSVQTKAEEPHTVVLASVDTIAAAAAPAPAATSVDASSVAAVVAPAVAPAPAPAPAPARVAWVAPRRAWHPPAHHKEVAAAAPAAAPKSAPKAVAAAAPAAPKAAAADDVESASAADALAKAQLEASLR